MTEKEFQEVLARDQEKFNKYVEPKTLPPILFTPISATPLKS